MYRSVGIKISPDRNGQTEKSCSGCLLLMTLAEETRENFIFVHLHMHHDSAPPWSRTKLDCWMPVRDRQYPVIRVANLAILKPDFAILAFFEHLWLFWKSRKDRQNLAFSGFFQSGRLGALDKHCLSCIFITDLFWKECRTMQDAQNIEKILLLH